MPIRYPAQRLFYVHSIQLIIISTLARDDFPLVPTMHLLELLLWILDAVLLRLLCGY